MKTDGKKLRRRRVRSLLMALVFALSTGSPSTGRTISQAVFDELYVQARDSLHRSEYEKALQVGERFLSLARQTNDRMQEARAFSLLGNVCYFLNRHPEALEYFRAALVAKREVGDRFGEGVALKDIGITCKELTRYDEGIEALHESLKVFRELGKNAEAGSALENIGGAYATVGAYNLAFEMYRQALEIAEKTDYTLLYFSSLTRIGDLYLSMDKSEQALDYLKRALDIAEKEDISPFNQSWVMMEIAIALLETGQTDAAIEMRMRSLSICRQIGYKSGIAYNYQGLGHVYLDRDPHLALRYLERALHLFQETDFRLMWGAYKSLGQAYRRLGDLDRAIEYFQMAVDSLDSMRERLASDRRRAMFFGKEQSVYHELIESLIERDSRNLRGEDAVRAFAVYERGKARALLEVIAEARLEIDRDLDPELRGRRDQLNARVAGVQKRLFASGVEAEERRELFEELANVDRDYDMLIAEIRRSNPQYATLQYPSPLTVEQARALLDPSQAIIAYSITRERVFAFLLSPSAFHAERLPVSSKELKARVQSYVDLVSQTDRPGWVDVSRRLYRDLIAPLRMHLPPEVSRLVIVPDDVLHYLPFETLVDGEQNKDDDIPDAVNQARSPDDSASSSRFLLDDFTISYAPSATVLNELKIFQRGMIGKSRADLLMLADPAIATGLLASDTPQTAADHTRSLYEDEGLEVLPIPFSAHEAEEIERYIGPGSEIYTGLNASEHRVKNSRLDNFRVLHFSTHGFISERNPDRSALILSSSEGDGEDGFLQAREIYQLRLASDLVVLSACQTARGQVLAGEGAQGLAQAFFYAGAQSVVASLWNVDDQTTSEFMERFYFHLANNMTKAEALRAAKLELMRKDITSAPRFWAAFILIGERDANVSISGPSWWFRNRLWLLIIAAVCSLVLLLTIGFRTVSFSLSRPRARYRKGK
ncbi:MAG TPA: CHAT domain-containing protein [Blastocatellia bacterium]|nr:CHAT domain-containing protein [Blastocatellia bacterium]